MNFTLFDILFGASAAAVYGAGFGAAAFMMDRLDILATDAWGATGYAIFGLPIWPVTLPAMLAYDALYRTTDEYREERMRKAERRLDEAIADARRLTEGGEA